MQQRIVIAIALACNPKLLVLDEPTTGLDATVEASVLDLVRSLVAEMDAAVLLIAHNLGVIRAMCDRVGVMYAGKIVEEGNAIAVFERPQHPYTVGLLQSLPRHGVRKSERPLATIPGTLPQIGTPLPTCVYVDRCPLATDLCREVIPPVVDVGNGQWTRCHHWERIGEIKAPPAGVAQAAVPQGDVALTVAQVSKTFHSSGHDIPAVVGIDLQLHGGETLGLVGESGSGKSTLAKTILGIESPDTGGRLELDDHQLAAQSAGRPTKDKRSIQMVFQNPDSALNRGWTARSILARSVTKLTGLKGKAVNDRVDKLAASLRLTQRHLDLKPRQLSGGLKQRVAIARAFAGDPRIVVADEPTSALDVSVQAAILNVLSELQAQSRTSYLLISHDLGVVRYLADRIAVMYLGRIMEVGESEAVFRGPEPPVHGSAAVRGAEPRRRGARPDPARRRGAEPREPAVGLRLPHAVPAGDPRPVRGDRAAPRGGGARSSDELPHPVRRVAPPPDQGRAGGPRVDHAGGVASGRKSRAVATRTAGHRRRTRRTHSGTARTGRAYPSRSARASARRCVSTSTWTRRPLTTAGSTR